MKKIIVLIIIITLFITGCGGNSIDESQKDEKGINIIVSIEPQKTFVEKVTGDLADINVVIPQGYSPANYQPSPIEIQDISNGDVYFSIGVESEKAFIIPKLKDLNEDIELINLQEKVKEKYELLYIEEEHNDDHEHDEGDVDPHIWLSPKRVITIVETIRDYMVEIDSDNKSQYINNAEEYIAELEKLDQDLKRTFEELDTKTFIIYHPSFSYFAKDYGLEMITIEEAGKEATAAKIQNVVDFARSNDIRVVFYQDEFDSSQAIVIANEIDGEVVEVTPLSGNYIDNMYEIRDKFEKVLNR